MEFFEANIKLGEVFVQLLAFVIIFWTLKTFAWKKIMNALEERRAKIQQELDAIEAAKKDLEAFKRQYTHALGHIEEEARAKLQEAVAQGKQISHELQEEARKNAQKILEKAKDDVALEVEKARISLRNEIADITLLAAEKLLEKKLDPTRDKELVLDFIQKLEQK